jgi:hypothetical protein
MRITSKTRALVRSASATPNAYDHVHALRETAMLNKSVASRVGMMNP